MEHYIQLYRDQYPFTLLNDSEYTKLMTGAELMEFKPNEFIIHEEERDENVEIHFMVNGLAKNILHRSNGKQVPIRFYYPGDLIGVMILLTSGEMKFSIQALEESNTLRFNKKIFMDLMSENPAFSKVVIDGISNLMKSLYQEVKFSSDNEKEEEDIYRKRADQFMEKALFFHPNKSIEEAARILQKENIERLIISSNEQEMAGTIGYPELLKAYTEDAYHSPAKYYMKKNNFAVSYQDFIYEALSYLKNNPADLIPVLHKEVVVGILRQSSFFEIKESPYFDLAHLISNAQSIDELQMLSPVHNQKFRQFITRLIEDGTFGYEISEIITGLNDRIHKQVIRLAEEEMVLEGYGPPQINYCFLVMGSQGRKEQGFSTDQDNGLILSDYHNFRDAPKITAYFKKLSKKINYKLVQCGFPYCSGGIMCQEDKWRKTLPEWKESLANWIQAMDAEEIRDFTIFLDFRPVYGDYSLAYQLREELVKKIENSLNLHQLLMKDTLRFRVPLQPIGKKIRTGKNKSLNLKKSATMQIVNAVRIYSSRYGIDEVPTVRRLDELVRQERYHPRDAENAKIALHHLLTFRIKENLRQLENNLPLTNEILIQDLTKDEKRRLREALSIAKRLQQALELSYNRNRVV